MAPTHPIGWKRSEIPRGRRPGAVAQSAPPRLGRHLEAQLSERAAELAAAGKELVRIADSADGSLRAVIRGSGQQIQELVHELVRLARINAELRGATAATAPEQRAIGGTHVMRTRHVILAGLMLAGVTAAIVAAAIDSSWRIPFTATPTAPARPAVTLFRPPLALLAALPADYTFDGGTTAEQNQVTAALSASSFDWNLVPQPVTIHIGSAYGTASSTPGNMWISSNLLDGGKFAWGVVQHEYAHQVDFDLLTTEMRAILEPLLGGKAWCYGGNDGGYLNVEGLQTIQYGCERFAEMIAWAYWRSPDNTMAPANLGLRQAPMDPAKFRALLSVMLAPGFSDLSAVPAYPSV